VLLIVLTMMGLFLQDRLPLPGWMLSLSSSSGQAQYHWSKRSSSFWASVMTGLLAAVVATPCTAPFMATALGFALTQPYWILMTIIWSLGLGLASPFILISFVPSIARCLPKSGPWLSSVKFYLAFPLYVTAVWLLWVFLQQMGVDAVLWVGCLSVLWLVLHSIQTEVWPKGLKRILSIGIVLAMIGSLVSLFSFSPISMTASPFTEDSIYQALDRRQSVFVDVTADWCLTCKVNEHAVLNTKTIQRFFKDNNITVIKADWTRYDENITAYLESFQRSGVPLYVVYQPGKEPVILPQQLTESRVMSAFNL
jgi:thiol:disulfide interchange protein